MTVNDITITSVETITNFDVTTGAYLYTLDELQSVSLAQSEEVTDITVKHGLKLATLKRNKAVTVSGANGLVSGGLLANQVGSKFENKATKVLWADNLVVEDDSATTSYTAVGTTGAEIEALYKKNSDGTLGDKLEQASAAASGKFAYAPTTKTLTFYSGEIADGGEIYVLYKRNITANVLENKSDKVSETVTMFIDCLGEDICSNVYRVQFYIPRASLNGNFTLDMGDNQTIHNFEAEALAGSCGAGGAFWTYTVFGANTEDTAVD